MNSRQRRQYKRRIEREYTPGTRVSMRYSLAEYYVVDVVYMMTVYNRGAQVRLSRSLGGPPVFTVSPGMLSKITTSGKLRTIR